MPNPITVSKCSVGIYLKEKGIDSQCISDTRGETNLSSTCNEREDCEYAAAGQTPSSLVCSAHKKEHAGLSDLNSTTPCTGNLWLYSEKVTYTNS